MLKSVFNNSGHRLLLLLLFTAAGAFVGFAQQKVDKRSLDSAVKEFREKTKIPLKLPTFFPFQPSATARDKRKILYARATIVDADGFQFNFCFSRTSCHSAFFYAEISGEKLAADAEKPEGEAVNLAKGIVGFYSKSSCGASCAPESIVWDEDGYRYTAFLEVSGDVQTLIKFVNSAINNEPNGVSEIKTESVYTGLTRNVCRDMKDKLWYRGQCRGVAGYVLEMIDGDSRMTLNVISPNGVKSELDFGANVSPAFSALGEKAEWRVVRDGAKIKPVALIVRFEISEPDHPVNPGNKSYLVVIKIADDSTCITDIVKPSKNQNVEARKLADAAGRKPCRAPVGT